ncbi:MAG: SPOR domain-containing protein, partial [Clostridia bacterium]
MRALFLLLVLANVAFFAWTRFYAPSDVAADPAPLARQIHPEKLRVVGTGEAPAASAAKPAPIAAAAPAATLPAAPAVAASPGSACLEWGSFTLADAPRAEKALEPLALGPRLAQRRTEETAGWWVFIAPQQPAANARQAAQKKASELKALKVDDYFIVSDEGPLRWSVSLGVFRTEEAAQARLAALRGQGVRSAQVGPRETVVPKVWLQ